MNGRTAKALRRKAFGDQSLKQKEYDFFTTVKRFFTGKTNKKGEKEIVNVHKNTVVCRGPRQAYLDLKQKYKKGGMKL